jgi:hypothetical protein
MGPKVSKLIYAVIAFDRNGEKERRKKLTYWHIINSAVAMLSNMLSRYIDFKGNFCCHQFFAERTSSNKAKQIIGNHRVSNMAPAILF